MTQQAQPLILQAAFTIETLAHLQGHEELLSQADHLRRIVKIIRDYEAGRDGYNGMLSNEAIEEILR